MNSNQINKKFPFHLPKNHKIRYPSFTLNNKTDLLFILKGKQNKDELIKNALNRGILIISDIKKKGIIYCKDLKQYITPFFLYFNHIQDNDFIYIAITGTSMKSSLAKLLFDIFNLLDEKVYLISSSFKGKNIYHSKLTTPWGNEFALALKRAKRKKIRYVIFEASSIGIATFRLNGIIPNVIFLTNLKEDHLDFHKTLKKYHETKISYMKLAKKIFMRKDIPYAFENKNVCYVEKNQIVQMGLKSKVIVDKKEYDLPHILPIETPIFDFIFTYFKDKIDQIPFNKIFYPKGRLEILNEDPLVMMDYAHSEDAFLSTVSYFSSLVKHSIAVFGAGGNREKQKRFAYGRIVKEYCDFGIVTEDNSRDEEFKDIASDIIKIDPSFFIVIEERKSAIKKAFSLLKKGDGVIFLGKGNEESIIKKGKIYPYNERKEILKNLKVYLKRTGA